MRRLIPILAVYALLTFVSGRAQAQGFKVIANPGVQMDSISSSNLKRVFLEEKRSLGGVHVKPVLARAGPAHEAFLLRLLGRTDSDLQNYYRILVFTGRGTVPKALDSDTEVVAYVAKTPGAIGYVRPDAATEGVRTLDVVGGANGPERKLVYRVEPEYPTLLRERSIGGTVKVRVLIAPSGRVEEAVLIGGDAVLGESAVAAVTKWKYSPAPSRMTTDVSVTFDPHR